MNDAIREDEGLDLEPFQDAALTDVVETIMLFGQFPRPRAKFNCYSPKARPREFDLYDFVSEHLSREDLIEFFLGQLTAKSEYEGQNRRSKAEKIIEQKLKEFLRGTEIVNRRAEELAEEAKS